MDLDNFHTAHDDEQDTELLRQVEMDLTLDEWSRYEDHFRNTCTRCKISYPYSGDPQDRNLCDRCDPPVGVCSHCQSAQPLVFQYWDNRPDYYLDSHHAPGVSDEPCDSPQNCYHNKCTGVASLPDAIVSRKD